MPFDRDRELRRIRRDLGTETGRNERSIRRTSTANQVGFDHDADSFFTDCDDCKSRVALHCANCRVKITGCNCTLADRVDEVTKQIRREQLGIWTPPNA